MPPTTPTVQQFSETHPIGIQNGGRKRTDILLLLPLWTSLSHDFIEYKWFSLSSALKKFPIRCARKCEHKSTHMYLPSNWMRTVFRWCITPKIPKGENVFNECVVRIFFGMTYGEFSIRKRGMMIRMMIQLKHLEHTWERSCRIDDGKIVPFRWFDGIWHSPYGIIWHTTKVMEVLKKKVAVEKSPRKKSWERHFSVKIGRTMCERLTKREMDICAVLIPVLLLNLCWWRKWAKWFPGCHVIFSKTSLGIGAEVYVWKA